MDKCPHSLCITPSLASETASCFLLYYDYFLTLVVEIERYWQPRAFTLSSALFLANRYLALLGYIPIIYEAVITSFQLSEPTGRASKLLMYHAVLIMLLQMLTASLFMLRTYALYERSQIILSVMIFEAVISVGIGCWVVSQLTVFDNDPVTNPKEGRLMAIAYSGLLVFDVTVFWLTMHRALRLRAQRRAPLIETLFIDGLLYYGVILNLNLVNILILAFGTSSFRGLISTSTNTISVVLVSRLMLNLRDPVLVQAIATRSEDLSVEFSLSWPWLSTAVRVNVFGPTFEPDDPPNAGSGGARYPVDGDGDRAHSGERNSSAGKRGRD
ncbi:hypothetical protein BV25DRAFT_1822463 [Artomyces pyxidatus]|uniref:Uncharacterized protein n=1 Tax=Artomyces pyxidatus TaxID=48021 RepID=A0ACB8TAG4_9AGAM|nr:hypothetical protein BV25DRAFT_1822463 [Artomyces pyxidatus]